MKGSRGSSIIWRPQNATSTGCTSHRRGPQSKVGITKQPGLCTARRSRTCMEVYNVMFSAGPHLKLSSASGLRGDTITITIAVTTVGTCQLALLLNYSLLVLVHLLDFLAMANTTWMQSNGPNPGQRCYKSTKIRASGSTTFALNPTHPKPKNIIVM